MTRKSKLQERSGRSARAARRAGTAGRTARAEKSETALQFTAVNGILAGAGVGTVALGYYLLGQGSITAAPLLLVLGYVVLLPLAIIR
jgi:hypothetical protein